MKQAQNIVKDWPDSHRGALCQAASSALQASVDLTHLHGSFESHNLQELVRQVWDKSKQKQQSKEKTLF